MSVLRLSQKSALAIFLIMVCFVLSMVTWWIILMARLTNEKVDLAVELGAASEYVERLHEQEISRQIMIGSEGVVFLVLILVGVWLIYRSLVQSERLQRRQENFLMAVTHELKTPLASLAVYLDTLNSDKIPLEKKQTLLPRMKDDLARLDGLVEDILEAGRFEASVYKPDRHRTDLGELLNEIAGNLRPANPGTPMQLTCHIETGVFIQADSPVIRRAVRAVLDNAVKYSGEADAVVTIALRRLRRYAEIKIADRGIGLEKKELTRIFGRFYRVGHELTRACRGTGLGLYLCRQMIRAHGGEVVARSEGIGHGTEFCITLPLDNHT